jgi:hypothetical protein
VVNQGTSYCNTPTGSIQPKIYVQYYCQRSKSEVANVREIGLGVGCFCVFAAVIYSLTIHYLMETQNCDFRAWDLSCLTAADFTLVYTIKESIWSEFKNVYQHIENSPFSMAVPNQPDGIPKRKVLAFAQYLEREILNRINKLPQVITTEPPLPPVWDRDLRIASIQFGFDNKDILSLLIKRGELITKGKFDDLHKVNKKLEQVVISDREKI